MNKDEINNTTSTEGEINELEQFSDYQRYIAASRYARFLPNEKRRETWFETVERYCNYFSEKYGDVFPRETLFNYIINLKSMPSMRALMTAGKALERDHAAGYNCAYIAIDDVRAFDETIYLLMCFAPETKIKTKRGLKQICELSIDDEVLSFNEELNQYEYIKPSNIVETPSAVREKMSLTFEDGSIVNCTSDHKFLTVNRGWVVAKDLTEEDDIKNFNEV